MKTRDEIKYHYTRNMDDVKKSPWGKYFTPKKLVDIVCSLIRPYVDSESWVIDPASGTGSFLADVGTDRVIGRDIDKEAVSLGRKHNIIDNLKWDNSLFNVSRKKYGLKDDDRIIVVGNPPYNDFTSKNKRGGARKKKKMEIPMDADIKTNDYGISFLLAYNKLGADVICILHPLSYLIKKTNFKRLGAFADNYVLKKGIIFSNREFPDTSQTAFPVLCALYERGSMDYEYIRNFPFDVLDDDRKFILKGIETIDGWIRKYPPRKSDEKVSDIGLYMYNIRDLNSLITSGNLTEKENFRNQITIRFKDLYKYAYLNSMRRNVEGDFLIGNLSPIVNRKELEGDEYLRDLFVIDTIINNGRLSCFNPENKKSIIHSRDLLEEYGSKAEKDYRDRPNPYRVFIQYSKGKRPEKEPVTQYIKKYFDSLKTKMLQGHRQNK